ncbi:dentin matrix acidic phosphoprotein 1-like [Folsomia candida]|uniref:Uncharacterized protein n=1 Tax=Folsomia candida TaxID=158441 RepID=A0A226E6L1_FOLCA|nr:dentin matrix acidic phosphoprotein 1-like [Folsomia candida]OXA52587.1 hypothetical protein Fcan01_12330 [Folsomia candida]
MATPPITKTSQVSVHQHYQHVIDTKLRNLYAAGIDETVLVDLGVQWRKKLAEMGTVTDFKDNRVMEESEIPSTSAGPSSSMNDIAEGDAVYILPPAQTVPVSVFVQPVVGDGPSVTVTVPVAALHGGILRQIISVPGMFEVSGEQDFTTVVQARVNEELRKRGLHTIEGRVPKKSRGMERCGRSSKIATRATSDEDESDVDDEQETELHAGPVQSSKIDNRDNDENDDDTQIIEHQAGRGGSSKIRARPTSDKDEDDRDDEQEIEPQASRGGRGAAKGRGRGGSSKIVRRDTSDKEENDMDDEQEIELKPGRGGRGAARGRERGRGRGQTSKIATRDTSDEEDNDKDDEQETELTPGRGGRGRGRGRSSEVAIRATSDKDETDMDDEQETELEPGRRGRGRGR